LPVTEAEKKFQTAFSKSWFGIWKKLTKVIRRREIDLKPWYPGAPIGPKENGLIGSRNGIYKQGGEKFPGNFLSALFRSEFLNCESLQKLVAGSPALHNNA